MVFNRVRRHHLCRKHFRNLCLQSTRTAMRNGRWLPGRSLYLWDLSEAAERRFVHQDFAVRNREYLLRRSMRDQRESALSAKRFLQHHEQRESSRYLLHTIQLFEHRIRLSSRSGTGRGVHQQRGLRRARVRGRTV